MQYRLQLDLFQEQLYLVLAVAAPELLLQYMGLELMVQVFIS